MNVDRVIHLSSAPQRAIKQRTKEERERKEGNRAMQGLRWLQGKGVLHGLRSLKGRAAGGR